MRGHRCRDDFWLGVPRLFRCLCVCVCKDVSRGWELCGGTVPKVRDSGTFLAESRPGLFVPLEDFEARSVGFSNELLLPGYWIASVGLGKRL